MVVYWSPSSCHWAKVLWHIASITIRLNFDKVKWVRGEKQVRHWRATHPVCWWKFWIKKKKLFTIKKKFPKKLFLSQSFTETTVAHLHNMWKAFLSLAATHIPRNQVCGMNPSHQPQQVERFFQTCYRMENPACIWRTKKSLWVDWTWVFFFTIELSVIYVFFPHLWAIVHHPLLPSRVGAAKKPEAANHLHRNNAHVQTHLLEE